MRLVAMMKTKRSVASPLSVGQLGGDAEHVAHGAEDDLRDEPVRMPRPAQPWRDARAQVVDARQGAVGQDVEAEPDGGGGNEKEDVARDGALAPWRRRPTLARERRLL